MKIENPTQWIEYVRAKRMDDCFGVVEDSDHLWCVVGNISGFIYSEHIFEGSAEAAAHRMQREHDARMYGGP